jgi:hypothetical protein
LSKKKELQQKEWGSNHIGKKQLEDEIVKKLQFSKSYKTNKTFERMETKYNR